MCCAWVVRFLERPTARALFCSSVGVSNILLLYGFKSLCVYLGIVLTWYVNLQVLKLPAWVCIVIASGWLLGFHALAIPIIIKKIKNRNSLKVRELNFSYDF